MRLRKLIAIFLTEILLLNPITVAAKSNGLSENQTRVANKVAKTATENWEKYGVLPSVAVAQTLVESSLGKNRVRSNNLWGLRPGGKYASYPSLENGIYAYLEVLNNGRYGKALYKKDYRTQIRRILQGGVLRRR